MKKLLIYFIIISILLISCNQQYSKTDSKITDLDLKTEDNVKIKATFYRGNKEMPSVILLHMLDRNRKDWDNFAKSLQNIGYNVISIDLRGHGQSDLNWRFFSEIDFNKMILDVKAAKEFLQKRGNNKIAIIGASIGANIALNYVAQDESIKTVVLLSPGSNYRGVKTEETIKQFKNPILIVVAENDSYSADSSQTLKSLSQNNVLKMYKGSEHGTRLFSKLDIDKVIIEWLEANLK